MEIILQDHLQPERVLDALIRASGQPFTQLGIGVAYTTLAGSLLLASRLGRDMGPQRWETTPKSIITCFDHGTTEPAALRYWMAEPNTEVRIYRPELLDTETLTPTKAFHAKLFYFERNPGASFIVGSANLTQRALTTNVEAIARIDVEDPGNPVTDVWARLVAGSVVANNDLVTRYENLRSVVPIVRVDSPINTAPIETRSLLTLWELMERGVQPDSFNNLWVQAGAMTGGSRNQLELPRGSHAFFGFEFHDYGDEVSDIGTPVLRSGPRSWNDRTLGWKGDNQMERINLPTQATGGFDYVHKAVLFRRHDAGHFEIIVADWDTDVSNAWRNASAEQLNVFKLGAHSNRICGFF